MAYEAKHYIEFKKKRRQKARTGLNSHLHHCRCLLTVCLRALWESLLLMMLMER